jgi:hypothetical protein
VTTNKRISKQITEKAKELGEVLTEWARTELKLPIGDVVRVNISIHKAVGVYFTPNQSDSAYNSQPTPEDWKKVFEIVRARIESSRSDGWKNIWDRVLQQLINLKRSNNHGRVRGAGDLNTLFRQHGCPYKVIQVDRKLKTRKHSLLVARES